MRLSSKHSFVLLPAIAAVSAHRGSAQALQPSADMPLRCRLVIEYGYARRNEPPGSCSGTIIIGSDASSFSQLNTEAVFMANGATGSPHAVAIAGAGR